MTKLPVNVVVSRKILTLIILNLKKIINDDEHRNFQLSRAGSLIKSAWIESSDAVLVPMRGNAGIPE